MRPDKLGHLPKELLTIGPREIQRVSPRPTLISVPGKRSPPLFLSLLLHGNETTSFFVLQALARRYAAAAPRWQARGEFRPCRA